MVWNASLSCLVVNVACSESWQWKRRRGNSWHRGLLLSASRTYQAASWAGWPGIRGWVWLPRKRLHPILQQSPCWEEGKVSPGTHTATELQENVGSAVLLAITGGFFPGQIQQARKQINVLPFLLVAPLVGTYQPKLSWTVFLCYFFVVYQFHILASFQNKSPSSSWSWRAVSRRTLVIWM